MVEVSREVPSGSGSSQPGFHDVVRGNVCPVDTKHEKDVSQSPTGDRRAPALTDFIKRAGRNASPDQSSVSSPYSDAIRGDEASFFQINSHMRLMEEKLNRLQKISYETETPPFILQHMWDDINACKTALSSEPGVTEHELYVALEKEITDKQEYHEIFIGLDKANPGRGYDRTVTALHTEIQQYSRYKQNLDGIREIRTQYESKLVENVQAYARPW